MTSFGLTVLAPVLDAVERYVLVDAAGAENAIAEAVDADPRVALDMAVGACAGLLRLLAAEVYGGDLPRAVAWLRAECERQVRAAEAARGVTP